jgi:hypothetical protein
VIHPWFEIELPDPFSKDDAATPLHYHIQENAKVDFGESFTVVEELEDLREQDGLES